ncbi:MAG TPA: T9SS type A sorting domain-containing protein, partial [Bacteroidia bacterium]|nr:T9SS type A sorting domain-containing protein [Bacteroidia bacterium]
GDAYVPGTNRGGGGGSGSTILIIGDKVNIPGHLSVKGGPGTIGPGTASDDGGGGGGGRIKVFYNSSYNNASAMDTSGGKSGVYGTFPPKDGSPGTYFDSLYQFHYGIADLQLPYPGGAVYITDSISICQGDSVLLGGDYQDSIGTYIDSFTTAYGCDSIRTTKLKVNPVFLTSLTHSICQGDSLFLGGSYRKIAGIYYDSLASNTGCDSVIETTLNINPTHLVFKSFSICQGDSIRIVHRYRKTGGIFIDSLKTTLGCDSIVANTLDVFPVYHIPQTATICKGDSIFIAGGYRKTAGIYPDNLLTSFGCDSIITTTLTVDSVNTGVTVTANALTAIATGASYKWLNCADNTPIANETSQSFTAAVNGSYAVEVTQNNCTDTSACYQVTGIGVNELISNNGITVYPNPASKELNVYIGSIPNENITLILFNTLGKKVIESAYNRANSHFTLLLESLVPGIYWLKIKYGNAVRIQQVIIE